MPVPKETDITLPVDLAHHYQHCVFKPKLSPGSRCAPMLPCSHAPIFITITIAIAIVIVSSA
jgi:hypothetical protein